MQGVIPGRPARPLTALLSAGQNGALKIIDRKKHIFKLAQGEYIAPEKIENIYLRSEPVAQVFVHGESLQVGAFRAVRSDRGRGEACLQAPVRWWDSSLA